MQDLSYLEFFAGEGNVFRCVRQHGIPAVAVDLTYYDAELDKNPFNINSASGLANLRFAQSTHVGFGEGVVVIEWSR